uniref:Reverse transcriptase Ty1/copia-type domain-containing protein n=1 Tax=Tanacetum cinerariifolium TaxID=118510 RepID=A0A6L2JG69_TANCI|nr:hypothetical protein [Tanacetum cinerariifolium]
MTDAKETWEAIKSKFGGNDESKKMQKYILKQQLESFSVSNSEGLHKGYDRFLSLLSQLEIHVSLIMRTKPGVDTLSFDDLYNILRVFDTNEASTAYGVSTSSGYNSQRGGSSLYTDELMYSFFANQSSGPQLDHEDLEQLDEFDLEEIDFKWQVAMISMRLKKFYKKTKRKLQFDAKEPVGFDKTKIECFNCRIFSYENGVFGSVFDSRSSDIEDSPLNDRYAEGMHAAPKQSKTSESDAETSNSASFESHSNVETLKSVPKPVANKPKAVSEHKVWSDAPIIEEYELDSDDEHVTIPSKEQEKPSFAFVNIVKHDDPQKALKKKGIVDSGCSRHMIGNKAYLVDYQDYNGGPVAFGGSKGHITSKGIKREYNNAIIPQQNGVAKRKNKTLIEATRTMLADSFLPNTFRAEAVSTACYVLNSLLDKRIKLTKLQDQKKLIIVQSSYTSTIKSSEAKNGGEKPKKDTGLKSNEKPVDQEEQAFLEELERLKRQEKEANVEVRALRKEFAQGTENLLRQIGAARASSTNTVNTVSKLVSTASPSRVFSAGELSYPDSTIYIDQDDSQIPAIEDIYDHPNLPYEKRAIGTKWVYRNKKDERGVVVRNKARLVALGYRQEERIDYDEMDVKSAFLYGTIDEKVTQPPGFVYPKYPKKNGYKRGTIDKTLFIKKDKKDIMLVKQKDDRIFISHDKYVVEILKKFDFISVKTASTSIETQKPLTKDEEAAEVDVHLYRSMIGYLMYLTASRPDIMFTVCACSRFQVTLKNLHLYAVKRIFRYLKGKPKPKPGLWYPRVSSFDLEAYSDSDYARANLDMKSTTGEYVAAANCCGQVLWIQNQMLEYGFNFMNTEIYIDNESTICIVKNPVFHSKTKHITIRHHFIRVAYEKSLFRLGKKMQFGLVLGALNGVYVLKILDLSFYNTLSFRKGLKFSGKITPLFPNMLIQAEGEGTYGSKGDQVQSPYNSPLSGGHTSDRAEDKGSVEKGGSTKELVSTARPEDSTVRPDVEEKAKEKGVSFKNIEDSSRPVRSILTLKPLLTIDPKDKGKGVLVELEPAKKMTRSDFDAAQIAKDAKVAELEREKEKSQSEEEASKAAIAEMYNEIQVGIEADALFAAKLQLEERKEYTNKERAKFLAETIAAQRRFRAA